MNVGDPPPMGKEALSESNRAEQALRQKTALVTLLQEVAVAANLGSSVEEAFRFCLDRVCAHTGWPIGHVYLPAEDPTAEPVPTTIWHLDRPEAFERFRTVTEATRFPPGRGMPGRVLASGRPAWITDVSKDPAFLRAEAAKDVGVKACFMFPVLVGPEAVAVLEFFSPHAAESDEPLLEVLANIGTQLGRVVERHRVEETFRKLRETGEKLASALDLDTVLSTLVTGAIGLVNAESGYAGLHRPDGMVCQRYFHKSTVVPLEACWPPGPALPGWLIEHKVPVLTNDALTDPRVPQELRERFGVRSALSAPILDGRGDVIGFLEIHNKKAASGFTRLDQEALVGVSHAASIAIQNARLYEESQRRAREATALAEIGRALSASLDMDSVLDQIVKEVQGLTGARFVGLMTLDEERQELVFAKGAGLSSDRMARARLPVAKGIAGHALAHRRPVQTANLQEELASEHRGIAEVEDFRSGLCIPLLARGRALGVLSVFRRELHEFPQVEVQLLVSFAAQAALALENARLYSLAKREAEELEQRVADRTAELREANAELEAFTYSVSHELLAPLWSIQGFARELLEHSPGRIDAAAHSDAQRIVAGAEQMRLLIRDLLAYSHLRCADLELERVDLSSVLADVLAQLQTDIQDRRAQVSVQDPLPAVVGNHTTLVQVVANLLANAIKYTAPAAQPQLRIWAEAHDEWVRLWVEDQGIGIAPEQFERIFRAFERLHDEKVYPGTGIGLAIVRKGIERMGGRVGLKSTPGQGSRFWVELPKP